MLMSMKDLVGLRKVKNLHLWLNDEEDYSNHVREC